MESTSKIATDILNAEVRSEALPEGSREAVSARLQAAHQAAYDVERDRLIGLCGDLMYTDGQEYAVRAVLTRAFGRFTSVRGERYGTTATPLRLDDVSAYIGSE